jgi:glycosyltransferase involved in cell wall biosynthesis
VRIGTVLLSVEMRGPERRLARLFRHLARQGRHSVYLVAPDRLLRTLKQGGILAEDDLELHSLGPDPGGEHLERLRGTHYAGFLAWRRLLAAALERADANGRTDVVHYLRPISYFMAPAAFRRRAVLEAIGATQGSWHLETMVREAARRGVAVSCLSLPVQRSLARGMAPDLVRRLHVSPGSMVSLPEVRDVPKQPLIAFAGWLDPVKNPFLFLDAIHLLSKRRRDFKAVLLSDGPLRRSVEEYVRARELDGIVDSHPSRSTAQVLAEALIFVTLQKLDNYPSQSLLDAMASGCAAVASDVGSTHRLVTPDTGLLVPLEAGAIADALEALLERPEQTQQMGRVARDLVAREHSVDRYAEYVDALYRSLS